MPKYTTSPGESKECLVTLVRHACLRDFPICGCLPYSFDFFVSDTPPFFHVQVIKMDLGGWLSDWHQSKLGPLMGGAVNAWLQLVVTSVCMLRDRVRGKNIINMHAARFFVLDL